MPVLPALLPAAAGVRAAGGSAGHLEGGVPPAESQRQQRSARLRPAGGTTLPPHSGAGKEASHWCFFCLCETLVPLDTEICSQKFYLKPFFNKLQVSFFFLQIRQVKTVLTT